MAGISGTMGDMAGGGLSVGKRWRAAALAALCVCLPLGTAQAQSRGEENALLIQRYEAYREGFAGLEHLEDLEAAGYEAIEEQRFPVELEAFGEAEFVPVLHREYRRLAVLIADGAGKILYKTDQLEANYRRLEQLEQPVRGLAAVSFRDLDGDGHRDITLIADCENDTGDYAGRRYQVGDVLFWRNGGFYRDWRVSDKLNRFSMNKSVDCIAAYVRDGSSTEILYTATTLEELLKNGFQIIKEQNYVRNFEKQGRLQVVPGVIRMAKYDVFMIYLVNGQGDIVWSFQPMEDYDSLYALKGMACKDLDGDGMKDILVLARYSYAGPEGERLIDTRCHIYYQRTDGFEEDGGFGEAYPCTEKDTVGELVRTIREYWGWAKEE